MTQYKLIPYNLRVMKVRTSDPLILGNINGNESDFFELLKEYLDENKSTNILDDVKKTISFEKVEVEERDIFGIIKSGEYGITADFYDIEKKEKRLLARRENDSELYPFFFQFHVPSDLTEGKLILQTFGVHGAQVVLLDTMNLFFHPLGYNIALNPLISKNLLEKFDKSRILEVRLIRKHVPKDIADKVHKGPVEDIFEERVYKVKRKRGFKLPESLKNLLSNKDAQYFELFNEKFDEIKTIIKESGSSITLTFAKDKNRLREALILEKGIKLDQGHPAYPEVLKISKEYMHHLTKSTSEA